ncbi:hypothetical protein HO133_008995 [Letharia lupina]|uniref:Maintenance of telomere capping protein 1 n=1 Tax=Letharia lupina TaxID=560253 RepID=A0A8H6FFN5_9LECA|nr:uncharacterized protein HO133_008995 [Letharia lupina]KAF6226129.1 hypothetical protein HO133_008995 [Letharia lupina]
MSKKEKLTDEELFAQFEGLEGDGTAVQAPKPATDGQQTDADLLEELGIPERPKPSSRPHTPRPQSTSTASGTRSSPKLTRAATPSSTDGARSSEEKARLRKSGDSTRSFHNSFTPASSGEGESEPEKSASFVPEAVQAQSSGGGWWGSVFSTASAAVKQAEALAKEIRQNEEAQRWAEQVKGNVGALRGLGGELRSRALPTFSNILHTLAPPISSHERLQIHITHDIVGYPSLDPLIYSTFSRVMAQVEGGDLMVIQRGQESTQRRGEDAGFTGSSSSGWSDGPWWRQATEARNLGAVKGLVEGTKLSKVSAESYATDYFAPRGGLEEAAKQATEVLSESNPVRSSDIFLAIQAISQTSPEDFFGGPTSQPKGEEGAVEPEEDDELISFAIYLHDPIHGITFNTVTQTLPQRWTEWLDASATSESAESGLPDEIAEIVNTGGVDPREWVAEWVEEVLSLGVGVVAQRYVARRMGVGLGGIGRGKARQEALESGGGEAARAV